MLRLFRIIALWEAISAVLLFFIALPIKYLLAEPLGIPIDIAEGFSYLVGLLHGVLFTVFVLMLMVCWNLFNWKFIRVFKYFIASMLPVISFWIELDVKKDINGTR